MRPDPAKYIDLERYPIQHPNSVDYQSMLDPITSELEEKGCAVLKGFIRQDCIAELIAEADGVAPYAHKSFSRTNAYFTKDDSGLPNSHPSRRFYDRSNAFVPADNFSADSILRSIYEWADFSPFIQQALGEKEFYRYADPLADVIINVVASGDGFPWHFDTNNFTVTLSIQSGEAGGIFQYSPMLRSTQDENFSSVQAVLDGDQSLIQSIQLGDGDLQIFKGRYSLHRVTAVTGGRTRYVAIYSYAEKPGVVASLERCQQLYGRVLPIHFEQANRRPDNLID